MKTSTTVTHDHAFADYWTIYRVLTLIVFCFLFVNFSLAPCGRRSWLAILASFLALVKFILSYRIPTHRFQAFVCVWSLATVGIWWGWESKPRGLQSSDDGRTVVLYYRELGVSVACLVRPPTQWLNLAVRAWVVAAGADDRDQSRGPRRRRLRPATSDADRRERAT